MTRMLGAGLLWIGVGIGMLGALALLPLAGVHGLSWIIGIGLIKLCLAGSIGLMAGGAFLRRMALRAEERQRGLAAASDARPISIEPPTER